MLNPLTHIENYLDDTVCKIIKIKIIYVKIKSHIHTTKKVFIKFYSK